MRTSLLAAVAATLVLPALINAQSQSSADSRVALTDPGGTVIYFEEASSSYNTAWPQAASYNFSTTLAAGSYRINTWVHAFGTAADFAGAESEAGVCVELVFGDPGNASITSSNGSVDTELTGYDPAGTPPGFEVLNAYSTPFTMPAMLTWNYNLPHASGQATGSGQWDVNPNPFGMQVIGTGYGIANFTSGPHDSTYDTRPEQDFYFTLATSMTVTLKGWTVSLDAGFSQRTPLLPNIGNGTFINVFTGSWFDPPLTTGYQFTMTSGDLFTDILELPSFIDGDGMFEVIVGGASLGQFAEGTGVDFVALLGSGVSEFQVVGIDPAANATNPMAFPIKLEFDTAIASFQMDPLVVRDVGASCLASLCPTCPLFELDAVGQPLLGNLTFGFQVNGAPSGGIGLVGINLGPAQSLPFKCGTIYTSANPPAQVIVALPGAGSCGGSGFVPLAIPNNPVYLGFILTAQAGVLCSGGGIGLTNGLEFAVGN